MKKKIIALLLTTMMISMAGCSEEKEEASNEKKDNGPKQESMIDAQDNENEDLEELENQEDVVIENEPQVTPEPTAEPILSTPLNYFQTVVKSDNTVCIKEFNFTYDGTEIIVPATIDGKPVVEISENAFQYARNAEKIVIPEGVKKIGNNAFDTCENLKEIVLPDSVEEIGQSAFNNCYSLESIVIPNNITELSAALFYNCKSLKSVQLPDKLTKIGGSFLGCTNLTDINIPLGVTEIASGTFKDCTSLAKITIPDGVTVINNNIFSGCTSLTDVVLPEGLVSIGNNSFENCSSLSQISLPTTLTQIGNYAFSGCTGLTQLDLPVSLTEIGEYALNGTAIQELHMPSGITTFDVKMVNGCQMLASLYYENLTDVNLENKIDKYMNLIRVVAPNAENFASDITSVTDSLTISVNSDKALESELPTNGVLSNDWFEYEVEYSKAKIIGMNKLKPIEKLQIISIPDEIDGYEVVEFTSKTFVGCVNLETIEASGERQFNRNDYYPIPSSFRTYKIKDGTTYVKHDVPLDAEVLIMPNTVTKIDSMSGYHLEKIVLSDSITEIATYRPFRSETYNLKSVYVGAGYPDISYYGFEECPVLEELIIPEGVTTLGGFWGCELITEIVIPSTTTTITENFMKNSGLTSLNLPEGITYIGDGAFSQCDSLNEVILPSSLTALENSAFEECNNITNLIIPEGVTKIGFYSFSKCKNLTSVELPESLTEINEFAFDNCPNLKEVIVTVGSVADTWAKEQGYTVVYK